MKSKSNIFLGMKNYQLKSTQMTQIKQIFADLLFNLRKSVKSASSACLKNSYISIALVCKKRIVLYFMEN